MGKIHKLPPEVVTSIAAGQVADKPASIVKELIENSLDAKAKQVIVQIEKSGLKTIRIVDDGEGMGVDDLQIASQQHTTSKIRTNEDLHRITSYGFRGEALSSISSMGKLVIKSRKNNSKHGYQIESNKGNISDPSPIGMKFGTIVEVTNLYEQVPARKKDLVKTKKETIEIVDVVLHSALSHPEIEYLLYIDGKEIIKAPVQSLRERIEILLGEFIAGGFIPITANDKGMEISGFIGSPQLAIKQKSRQYLFVNKRSITNDDISLYIKNLYSTLIDPRLHPAYLIFITLPVDQVDINVTPKKDKVQFFTQNELMKLLDEAIKPKLTSSNHRYEFELTPEMDKKTAFVLKDAVSKWSVKPENLKNKEFIQVDNTFLVTQTNSNLLIVDQHAAHERILYEQLLDVFNKKKKDIAKLSKAIKLNLPKNEQLLFTNIQNVFSQLGFHTDISDKNIVVSEVPYVFKDRNISQLISEMLNDLSLNQNNLDSLTNKTISFMACKGAIKAGDDLTAKECENLLEKLFHTQTSYTCPHGRPVMIEIPLSQLHTAFRRK